MEYSTTTEMALKWDISPRRIAFLCVHNRIQGVVKKGKTWLIPTNSYKPKDARRNKEDRINAER